MMGAPADGDAVGQDQIGQGMDAALTLLLFVGIGFAVDRWLGTTPLFMIVLFLLVAVIQFIAWKARYTVRMEALEAQRRAGATRHRALPTDRPSDYPPMSDR